MAFSRYSRDARLSAGYQLGSPSAIRTVRDGIKQGRISITRQVITTGVDRLDVLSGIFYGDSRYWWVLAAGSDIGWGMQVPPGTVINVPDLRDVERLVT